MFYLYLYYFYGPLLPAKFHLDQLRGVGLRPQKNSNFTNFVAPKERIPCAILTKFIEFMRALDLHNYAKFRVFCQIFDDS